MPSARRPFLALCALALSLTACASSTPDDVETQTTVYPFIRLSPSPPPPAPFDPKPDASDPMAQVWRQGYWSYDGRAFSWIPGYYMMKPIPTAAWTPDRWERRQFGWAFVPGYWQ